MLFKSKKKQLITPVLAVFASAAISFMASAETSNNVTLDISTDKQSYSSGEQVSVTVSAFNGTEKDLKNVIITEAVPSGFDLVGRHSLTLNNPVLSAGSSLQDNYIIVPTPGSGSGSQPGDDAAYHTSGTSSPRVSSAIAPTATSNTQAEDVSAGEGLDGDGDTLVVNTGKFAVIFLISLAVILSVALLAKDKKALKKILSLFTAMFIFVPFCADMGTVKVSAESGALNASTKFVYNGTEYTIGVGMSYNIEYMDVLLNPNIGTYTEDNPGEIYGYNTPLENIVSEGISMYANNEILVVADPDIAKEVISDIAAKYGASIVGWIEQTGDYQWLIERELSLTEIETLANTIKAEKYILDAYPNYAFIIGNENYDAKKAMYNFQGDWLSDILNNPYDCKGISRGFEMVFGPSTYEFLLNTVVGDQANPIRIGLIDNGFDENHQDLDFANNGVFYNHVEGDSEHGTHVAGIMAANADNNIGICGTYPYGADNVYAVSTRGVSQYSENGSFFTTSSYKILFAELLLRNVKVINMSAGNNYYKENNWKYYDGNEWRKENNCGFLPNSGIRWDNWTAYMESKVYIESDFLRRIYDEGFDFIICTSAGNDSHRSKGEIYDSKYNSFITLIDDPVIKDRIIVVGSVDSTGVYADNSNGGDRVDVLAPGVKIYSTIPGNNYTELSGTSMASPQVAGIAATVWSVNSGLTGAQVKQLVCSNTKTFGNNAVVNELYSVLSAIKTKGEGTPGSNAGAILGWVVEQADEKKSIIEATITAVNESNGERITTTSDENGHFELFLPAGNYNLLVQKENYKEWKTSNQLTVSAGEVTYPDYWIKLESETDTDTEFNTHIVAEDTGNTLDADVLLYNADTYEEGREPLYQFKAVNGEVKENIPAGKYTIVYKYEGYEDYIERNWEVNTGEESYHTVTMKPVGSATGTFSGSVIDAETNEPINADVYMFSSDYDIENYNIDDALYHVTAVDGEISFKAEPGNYNVLFTLDGYEDLVFDSYEITEDPNVGDPPYFSAEMTKTEAEFAGGDGSESDPYQVATAEQLNNVRNHLDAHYIQVADIDLSGFDKWQKIGSIDEQFAGTFNGNDYTISNLSIEDRGSKRSSSYNGLFAVLNGAVIENVNMDNVHIGVYAGTNGAIAGSTDSDTFIKNCIISGNVNGYGDYGHYTGGVVGVNEGRIENVTFSGRVDGENYVGGIAASNERGGSIINCKTNSNSENDRISGYHPGGIVGSNSGNIVDCENNNHVVGNYWYGPQTGGVAGINSGTIERCVNNGTVRGVCNSGSDTVGGIVGSNSGTIKFCYNTGYVSADRINVYGISKNGTIISCYNIGDVEGRMENGYADDNIHEYGVANTDETNVTSCYYIDTIPEAGNGIRLSDDQMKRPESFVGFDFENVWTFEGSETGYPVLRPYEEN